ncbi:MAG: hypothetical protein GKR86_14535, partial [Ilumatobacter sp.]|nr:hypothetical protein [Ilumatobacter sp.]
MPETQTTDEPIHACIERWHDHMRGRLAGGLDAMLHPDVVFLSPIVFTPQVGRDITKLYLTAAGGTLGGDATGDEATDESPSEGSESNKQREDKRMKAFAGHIASAFKLTAAAGLVAMGSSGTGAGALG